MSERYLHVAAGPEEGRRIAVEEEIRIGRHERETLGGDPELSRRHARITLADERTAVVEDLGSTNGTYLNGWRIPSPQILSPGDTIQVGQSLLEFTVPAGAEPSGRFPAVLAGEAGGEPSPSAILSTRGVTKSYGDRPVLQSVDLDVQPGEIVGLLGHNGAGKTTFVSIVAGLRPADSGLVRVNGIDALADPITARRYMGLAPQDLGIYPTATVKRNLEFYGELAGLSGADLRRRVHEVGEQLSLTALFDRPAAQTSGGEKRRLHTGMAMIHHPPLLILDEPTVGADVRTRAEILRTVKLLASQGRGIVYSTHYLPEIEELGASVAILQSGQIIARGSIAELIARHSSQAVELHFDGPAPELSLDVRASVDGATIRIVTDEPDRTAATVLGQLGPYVHRLLGVEIVRPSLESVYLTLTEQRYAAAENESPGYAEHEPQQAEVPSYVAGPY